MSVCCNRSELSLYRFVMNCCRMHENDGLHAAL